MIGLLGACGFGLLIGWYVYFINRHRKGDVQFSDLTTLIGVIGGGTITALFPTTGQVSSNVALFGAYGIGLAVGFFAYLVFLIGLVKTSTNFDMDWFLDGRRKEVQAGYTIPGYIEQPPRQMDPSGGEHQTAAVAGATAAAVAEVFRQNQRTIALDAVQPAAQDLIGACESVYETNKGDCNAFAKAVTQRFGITLTGQADDIVDQMSGLGWSPVMGGVKAKTLAEAGMLVLAGLKGSEHSPSREHGHVAVVVAGPLAHSSYPTGYWGSLGGTPGRSKTLNWAWAAADRDSIRYAARSIEA